MAEPVEGDTIVEEREEIMVSLSNGPPTRRIAHFLNSSATSADEAAFHPPSHSLSSASSKKPPLKVTFNGWRHPPTSWGNWVDHMRSLHHSLWKKMGIYDSIINSTYSIQRDDNLILSIAEKWSPETKTFLFPFAEATITLEDMIVLWGYPVLGDPVVRPLDEGDLKKTREKLLESRLEVVRTKAQKASQHTWIKKFMRSGSEIEHEAFLSFWLSRFVFPAFSVDTIGKHVFSMAVLLASGTKIALAPAVLAIIYRDLSLLKEKIVASNKFAPEEWEQNVSTLTIWAPFQLVQLWVWERFSTPRPNKRPNNRDLTGEDEPRLARWQNGKKPNTVNLALGIALEGKFFRWRPYSLAGPNILFQKLWDEKKEWLPVSTPRLNDELESFARCLRVSELVGPDCIEQYLPNRVARQFGFDQDLPGFVPRRNATSRIAWGNYTRPVRDAKLYIPRRLFEPSVTTEYSDWWKKLNNARLDSAKKENDSGKTGGYKSPVHLEHRPKFIRKKYLEQWKMLNNTRLHPSTGAVKKENDSVETGDYKSPENRPKFTGKIANKSHDSAIPPGFPSKSTGIMADNGPFSAISLDAWYDIPPGFPSKSTGKMAEKGPSSVIPNRSFKCIGKNARDDPPAPPGFSPEFVKVEEKDFVEEDKLTLTQLVKKMNGSGRGRQVEDHLLPSSDSDNGSLRSVGMTMNPEKKIGGNDREVEENASERVSINSNGGEGSEHPGNRIPGLELEARIAKLENLIYQIKKERLGDKF